VAAAAEEYANPTVPLLVGQVSVRVGGEITILQLVVVVPDALPVESTTCAVKLNVPAVVGVPVMAPVELFSVKPAGSDPLVMENVYGGVPPPATRAELYATPTCPVPVGQVRVGGGSTTTMLQFEAVVPAELPLESTTCAVKLNVPVVLGVPVMAPVAVFSVNPAGSDPLVSEKVYGPTPPDATSDEVYTIPVGPIGVAQTSVGGAT